jgi:hypothetical protein
MFFTLSPYLFLLQLMTFIFVLVDCCFVCDLLSMVFIIFWLIVYMIVIIEDKMIGLMIGAH